MDLNPLKKIKPVSSPSAAPGLAIRTVDELNSGKKLITKLNHDCLSKVLMHLPILERLEMENVCQKWKEAAELSWWNIQKLAINDLMITLDERDEKLKMIISRCGQYLSHLKITGYQYPWMNSLLKEKCQNVVHFEIDVTEENKFKITNKKLAKIISSMEKLKSLKITINFKNSCKLCNLIVHELPEDMEEIHLAIPSDQPYGFAPVLNKFHNLHWLELQGFILNNDTLDAILQNKSTLSQLDLPFCKFPKNAPPIFSNLNNLEHLNLSQTEDFNMNEVDSIIHNCLKLNHLEFMNRNSDDGEVEYIPFRIFCNLKYLNLQHLYFVALEESDHLGKNKVSGIASNWNKLKHLSINNGEDFTAADIQEITKFKHLERLMIGFTSLDSEAFVNIASNCLELKELRIRYDKLSEIALEKLTNLKKLEKLNFFSCKNLTGDLLSKIVNNCKNLVELDLSSREECKASLLEVGKLENLKILNVDYISDVPNAMFYNLRKLENLSCEWCETVTDEGIIRVLANCRKLSKLNVYDTKISVKSLFYAAKRKVVFTPLEIWAGGSAKRNYERINLGATPYLRVNGKKP